MDQLTTEQIIYGLGSFGFYVACVAWAWYIAVQKDRWWYEGFWMGASLGPFGVIAAACMPAGEPLPAAVEPGVLKSRHENGDEQVKRYRERKLTAEPDKKFPMF